MGRRQLEIVQALTGRDFSPEGAFASAGLDPLAARKLKRRRNIEKAKKDAEDDAGSLSKLSKVLAYGSGIGGPLLSPLVKKFAGDGAELAARSMSGPFGYASAEKEVQARQLRGEDVPGVAKTALKVGSISPSNTMTAGVFDEHGRPSWSGAGRSAIEGAEAALAALAAIPTGGTSVALYAAGRANQALNPDPQTRKYVGYGLKAAQLGATLAGGGASPEAPDSAPIVHPTVQAKFAEAARPAAPEWMNAVDKAYNFPGSLLRPEGEGFLPSAGRAAAGSLPTAGGTAGDVLGAVKAQGTRRVQRLISRAGARPPRGVDPFGFLEKPEPSVVQRSIARYFGG